jgi:hypothetical protein
MTILPILNHPPVLEKKEVMKIRRCEVGIKTAPNLILRSHQKQNFPAFFSIELSIEMIASYSSSNSRNIACEMYLQAMLKSSQHSVSEASAIESVSLFLKTASYFLFHHASAKFEHTALDALLICPVSEYFPSAGKDFVISNIRIAA